MDKTYSYDRLAYPSKIFVQTHPDRLATVATLFGMTPASVTSCRVLELGCGNGSNLIAQAFLFRDSQFVGIDLSKNHIDDAIAATRELGLTNVEFKQADVSEMSTSEYGKFDFIVAHGLFSWVPEFVRTAVLELFRELLNKDGVGYISYSAYPGAYHRQMVQSMLRIHTADRSEPVEKVEKALSLLAFLDENTSDSGVYQSILTQELKRHAEHGAADIYHDDLSDDNRAFYFSEFASLLEAAGLQFVGEAELHAMGMQNLSPEARNFIQSFEDPIEREQYRDFLSGRIFRQTLICHKEVALTRDIDPSMMDSVLISSSLRPLNEKPDLVSQKVEKFVGSNKTGIEIDQPLVKAALVYLGSIWGRAASFQELIENGKKMLERDGYRGEDWETQTNITRMVLLQIAFATTTVELHVHKPDAFMAISSRPQVNELSRYQMANSDKILTTLDIVLKIEDRVSRRLLELLDGTRDRDALIEEMGKFIRSADDLDGRDELLKNLAEWVNESLTDLARIGVFTA